MRVAESIDQLRGRFYRMRARYPLETVAPAIGVNINTLYRFLRGDSVAQITLTKIEQWCDRQETVRGES